MNVEVKIVAPALEAVLLSIAEALERGQEVKSVNGGVLDAKKGEIPENKSIITQKEVTLQDLRVALIEKSRKGKQAQIKVLIQKFGGKKLTDISKEKYEEFMKEVGEL
ncbi:hypothetical protein [Clostridium sp. DL1XJH146]